MSGIVPLTAGWPVADGRGSGSHRMVREKPLVKVMLDIYNLCVILATEAGCQAFINLSNSQQVAAGLTRLFISESNSFCFILGAVRSKGYTVTGILLRTDIGPCVALRWLLHVSVPSARLRLVGHACGRREESERV